jgi:hypothetical protein
MVIIGGDDEDDVKFVFVTFFEPDDDMVHLLSLSVDSTISDPLHIRIFS